MKSVRAAFAESRSTPWERPGDGGPRSGDPTAHRRHRTAPTASTCTRGLRNPGGPRRSPGGQRRKRLLCLCPSPPSADESEGSGADGVRTDGGPANLFRHVSDERKESTLIDAKFSGPLSGHPGTRNAQTHSPSPFGVIAFRWCERPCNLATRFRTPVFPEGGGGLRLVVSSICASTLPFSALAPLANWAPNRLRISSNTIL